ncbi:GNAT family N-acetyltransferase [Nocardioides sp.]|uniref:GNAT family N-acetyltransferase n=1 Tax=Nocardioides sp. TaxID=35761 RepID=UPI002ED7910A
MTPPPVVRPVADSEWGIVAWLWQDFRHDLGAIVGGFPYADGRYRHEWLDEHPRADGAGYLAWRPHPNTGEDAPVAFATVRGVGSGTCTMQAFFVVPAARRGGLGGWLAREIVERHPGAWSIPFQHGNEAAAAFWRGVASELWGEAWAEAEESVPGKPDLPPDHWIRTTLSP